MADKRQTLSEQLARHAFKFEFLFEKIFKTDTGYPYFSSFPFNYLTIKTIYSDVEFKKKLIKDLRNTCS